MATRPNRMNETSYTCSHFVLLIFFFRSWILLRNRSMENVNVFVSFRRNTKRASTSWYGIVPSVTTQKRIRYFFLFLNGANRFTNFGICVLQDGWAQFRCWFQHISQIRDIIGKIPLLLIEFYCSTFWETGEKAFYLVPINMIVCCALWYFTLVNAACFISSLASTNEAT